MEAEIGSGNNARTDTDTDDATDTAGTNKVSAELTSHTTLYVTKEMNDDGLYIKGGLAMASLIQQKHLLQELHTVTKMFLV